MDVAWAVLGDALESKSLCGWVFPNRFLESRDRSRGQHLVGIDDDAPVPRGKVERGVSSVGEVIPPFVIGQPDALIIETVHKKQRVIRRSCVAHDDLVHVTEGLYTIKNVVCLILADDGSRDFHAFVIPTFWAAAISSGRQPPRPADARVRCAPEHREERPA